MKLLRYLKTIELYKNVKEKQPNGVHIDKATYINTYKTSKRNLTDEVSATVYGANIEKMYSISSPLKDLEKFLKTKVDNKEDNISLYMIKFDGSNYKINSVKDYEVIIERL